MISIGKFLGRNTVANWPSAVAEFGSALFETIGNSAVNYDQTSYESFQAGLRALAVQVNVATHPEELPLVVDNFAVIVKENESGREKIWKARTEELRSMVELLTRSLGVLGLDSQSSLDQLKTLGENLDRVKTLNDVVEFKSKFKKSLDEIQQVEKSRRQKMAAEMGEIRRELQESKSRLEQLQVDPNTDVVTGLPTRELAISKIEALSTGKDLSFVMVLTIQTLPMINAKYGRLAGNLALQGYKDHLESRMSGRGGLFRWGGNCFTAIFPIKEVSKDDGDLVRALGGNANIEIELDGTQHAIAICPKWLCLGRTELLAVQTLVEKIDRFAADL